MAVVLPELKQTGPKWKKKKKNVFRYRNKVASKILMLLA
jgi:hypothetical protein